MSTELALPAPGTIAVGSLAQARRHKRRYDALLTLEDPKAKPGDRLRFTAAPKPPHLVLAFEDADSEEYGYRTMTADQMEMVLAFGREHACGSLLVHCFHGVGRSAACALAILADRAGSGHDADAVARLFAIRPTATPNLVAVALADAALGRDGALVAALEEHEAADPTFAPRRTRRHRFALENPSLYARKEGA